jgi:hypothetical protein
MVFADFSKSNSPAYTAVSKDEIEAYSLLSPSREQQQAYKRASRTPIILSHAATFLIVVLVTAATLYYPTHPHSSKQKQSRT